jgi:hypothetical protein
MIWRLDTSRVWIDSGLLRLKWLGLSRVLHRHWWRGDLPANVGTGRGITFSGSPVSRQFAGDIDTVLAPHVSALQAERRAPVV